MLPIELDAATVVIVVVIVCGYKNFANNPNPNPVWSLIAADAGRFDAVAIAARGGDDTGGRFAA